MSIGIRSKIIVFNIFLLVITVGALFYLSYTGLTGDLIYTAGIVLAVGIISSILFAWFVGRKLRKLADITEGISKGKVEQAIEVKAGGEIGKLVESIERMRISLKMAMEMLSDTEK